MHSSAGICEHRFRWKKYLPHYHTSSECKEIIRFNFEGKASICMSNVGVLTHMYVYVLCMFAYGLSVLRFSFSSPFSFLCICRVCVCVCVCLAWGVVGGLWGLDVWMPYSVWQDDSDSAAETQILHLHHSVTASACLKENSCYHLTLQEKH